MQQIKHYDQDEVFHIMDSITREREDCYVVRNSAVGYWNTNLQYFDFTTKRNLYMITGFVNFLSTLDKMIDYKKR